MNVNKGVFALALQFISVMAVSVVTGPIVWAATNSIQCTGTAAATSISLTDWETGLGAWDVGTHDVARPATFDTPDWAVVGSLPGGRSGSAAFVANLDKGDCGADDETGALTLTSPEIVIPTDASDLHISFNHWFHIEYGWDGGNLKISVNGGPYDLVPASAFQAVPYTGTLFDAFDSDGISYNTNPLAEQAAFTGPEGEQVTGSWSESRVDLLGIAGPGDTIRLQFDFGVDACFGKVGWYVDEVEVYGCVEESPPQDTRLTLVKRVVNDNGGSALSSAWTLTATGPTGFSGTGPSVSSGSGFQPGTYDLSESGGPAGYAASAWVCSGGTQVDADTITLAVGDNATCTITNDDLDTDYQINAGHSGAWYNPDTGGQGILIDIGPPGQDMFIAWFTFTDAESEDPFEHRWLTAQGKYSGGTAQLVLNETLGGRFDDPQPVNTNPVGEVTLNFFDCDTAEMTYRFDNEDLQGTIPLTRVIPGSENVCLEQSGYSMQAVDINAGMDGAWYNGDTSGQGFLIDAHTNPQGANFIFVAWFTYGDDTASGQRWLTAQGNFEGPTVEMNITETTGGSFDDPLPPGRDTVGTMRIDFEDCSHAVLSYTLPDDGAENQIPIKRLLTGEEALCEEIAGLE